MRDEKEKPSFAESLAGETKKGLDDAAALPERLSRYAGAHHRALDMADYIKNMAMNQMKNVATFPMKNVSTFLSAQLKSCGSYLAFRDYFRVGKVRLSSMRSCKKHLLCPLCAMRRGAKMLKAYLDRLEVIRQEHPTIKAFLVTITVKDGEDLLERFNHLQSSLQTYNDQRRNAIKGLRSLVEYNKALGAVGSYEFKRGSGSGLWHPHYHAVWLCYETPDQEQLAREWHEITGDSFIVNVTPFHDQEDVVSGFLEVFKYAVKFSDLPLDQNWEGYEALQGKRLVNSFGLFRGVQVPENNEDDLLDDEPYVEMFFRFVKGAGYSLAKVSQVKEPVQRLADAAPRSNLVNLVGHLAEKYPTRADTKYERLLLER